MFRLADPPLRARSTAKDVVLSDVLPSNAQLLSGSLSASFPAIASGSTVKHTYTLVFTAGGSMDITFLPSGTVTYKGDSEGTEQVGNPHVCTDLRSLDCNG
jgi:hypothetical protein